MIFDIGLKGLLVGLFLLIATVVALTFIYRAYLKPGSKEVLSKFGLDGWIVYSDDDLKSRVFVSKKYKIKAKPDFIVRLRSGGYVIIEYKSRENGRLYTSDVAQVKATVLAVRSEFSVKTAYVLAGKTRHEVDVNKSSGKIFKEIRLQVDQAKRAATGEIIFSFPPGVQQCSSCSQRSNCKNPKLRAI